MGDQERAREVTARMDEVMQLPDDFAGLRPSEPAPMTLAAEPSKVMPLTASEQAARIAAADISNRHKTIGNSTRGAWADGGDPIDGICAI